MGAENKFKIGQKVMVVKPVREEDRFKVGTVDSMYTDDSGHWVVIITAEAREFYLEAMLEPLPEMLQGKTIEEAERAVKGIQKAVDAIRAMAKALKEADKDKRIAELEKQVEDLKRELVHRPIVVLPKEAVVNIRVGKAMEEYEAIKSRN